MEMISCVGGTLPHAVRSLVKYKVPTVESKVGIQDLQITQTTRDNNKLFKKIMYKKHYRHHL